jgi:hypothetical protein
MHKPGERCFDLIKTTADALSGSVVSVMLLTVQKDNLELNISQAIKWYVSIYSMDEMVGLFSFHRAHSMFQQGHGTTETVVKLCIMAFPTIWVSFNVVY